MRYLCIHKADATTEAGLPPRAELLEGIGPLLEDMQKAGVFRSAEGLRPSSTGVRLSFSKGKRTLTKGPFTGGNELVAGFLLVQVETLDDAVDWASRFAEAVGDVEIDVRPLTEYWDIGVVPKPSPVVEGCSTGSFSPSTRISASRVERKGLVWATSRA